VKLLYLVLSNETINQLLQEVNLNFSNFNIFNFYLLNQELILHFPHIKIVNSIFFADYFKFFFFFIINKEFLIYFSF